MANFQKDKKYYFTYKTTNLINNRYYLGMHSTNNINDNYVGSGKRLWYEIRKYGKENFKIEILNYYNNIEELINAEKVLITENDINNNNCLNLKLGGSGGFTSENTKKGGKLSGKKHADKLINDIKYRENFLDKISKIKYEMFIIMGNEYPLIKNRTDWSGRKHSPETIKKMKLSKKNHGKGCLNSQFGKCWITNGKENKKIYKTDNIPKGWNFGRKLK